MTRSRMVVGGLATVTALGVTTVLGMSSAAAVPNNNTAAKLTKAVTAEGVLDHLEALQAIADDNGGDRAAGRPGYDDSVAYVVEQLRAAGYTPEVQPFAFTYAEENSQLVRTSAPARTFVEGTDFLRNTFDTGSPEGTATGTLVPVEPGGTTAGCEATDFTGFAAGSIALIQRGGCPFATKALNAQAAGAAGVVIWNNTTGLINMIGPAAGLTIPAVFATIEAGSDLAATPGATVTVTVDYAAEERTTYNVIAQTSSGRTDNVVMAGAHLDSVQEGAGINDNGSGSAALLETAIQMQKVKPNNAVRFAWWGAEEEGLLGSEYYVGQLTDDEIADIGLYLNFDMIASPNYTTGIYDGDNSGGTAPEGFIPAGSAQIEDVFEGFYASRGLPYVDSEFSGRSDYGPFIAEGIPSGGLFTGAEVPKTAAEAAVFGGVAGASLDPCYHAECDNLTGEGQDEALYAALAEDYTLVGNVNVEALDQNSDALATAVITFAYDTSAVNAVPRSPGRSHGAGNSENAGQHGHGTDAAA
ncbi:PA domain-containing protein [Geodermatophilus saharensis]|uniref:PA domain-containing protein n=1 Tax=Geodermatophilus saharensis TaxID=1137994 RepID=A0A239DHI9_9ACTN|nr:M28 family peptidase [Geodermatophilus saharensis]SNS31886.1 PA domain-containing protein [Geodermatophilus saharensis]